MAIRETKTINQDNRLIDSKKTIENLDIRNSTDFIVPKSYLEKGGNMIKPQLVEMSSLGEYVDVEKPTIRVMAFMSKKNDGVDYSIILRAAKLPTEKLKKILITLLAQEYLVDKTVKKSTKRGIVGIGYYKINHKRKDKKIIMMTDQQLQQKFNDLCEDGLWTIFETKETKVPERAHNWWIPTENGNIIAELLK